MFERPYRALYTIACISAVRPSFKGRRDGARRAAAAAAAAAKKQHKKERIEGDRDEEAMACEGRRDSYVRMCVGVNMPQI
jgi:xanthine dehydrogenase molybdopterin-binding subunit B